ncbi:hypothetical protein DPEC_G00094890 [Dallia pectoralis]|uniref:Uncharacterized protein n=1 Tax=Dallia pectoralis TaxID=75939 RepID=A0ACC2H1W8_DALPE|nr:hypothetical protein DPEC_G00094890 [Dallia pectoralis]
METVVLDTDSEDEISGSSMMLSGNSGCKRRLSACESSQGGEASNCVKKPAVQEDSVVSLAVFTTVPPPASLKPNRWEEGGVIFSLRLTSITEPRTRAEGAPDLIGLRSYWPTVFLYFQTDDSENEGSEPSWRSQENMVRKLQDKFPHLVKEELREVLLKHDWQLEDTLEALRMFSEEVETPSQVDIPASSSASSAPQTAAGQAAANPPSRRPSPPHRPVDGTGSTSMNRLTNKRRWIPEPGTSSEDVSSDDLESESKGVELNWEDSGSEQEVGHGSPVKGQILKFFQEASLDELSLI